MSWARWSDDAVNHRKARELRSRYGPIEGMAAWGWFGAAVGYGCRYLTDGFVPDKDLAIVAEGVPPRYYRRWIALLEKVGCLERRPRGWQIHGFLEYQPDAASEKARKKNEARQKALMRDAALREAIRQRDGDRCVYCTTLVVWGARGPDAGTYDHVDPDGPNALVNVVIACRACNAAKRDGREGRVPPALVERVRARVLALSGRTAPGRRPDTDRDGDGTGRDGPDRVEPSRNGTGVHGAFPEADRATQSVPGDGEREEER